MNSLGNGMNVRLVVAATCVCMAVMGAPRAADGPEDEVETRLPEPELVLPPAPVSSNLIPLYVAPNTVNAFFIDGKSLSVQAGGFIRYTIVIRSPAGASTVNFEGMRCPGWERKIHASGRPDGNWSKARGDTWSPIGGSGPNGYPYVLYRYHFCADGVPIHDAAEGIASLRRSGDPMIKLMPGWN
jgi:hypothetical protein